MSWLPEKLQPRSGSSQAQSRGECAGDTSEHGRHTSAWWHLEMKMAAPAGSCPAGDGGGGESAPASGGRLGGCVWGSSTNPVCPSTGEARPGSAGRERKRP